MCKYSELLVGFSALIRIVVQPSAGFELLGKGIDRGERSTPAHRGVHVRGAALRDSLSNRTRHCCGSRLPFLLAAAAAAGCLTHGSGEAGAYTNMRNPHISSKRRLEPPLAPRVLAARNKEMKMRLSTSSLVLGDVAGPETRDWSLSSTQLRPGHGAGALDPAQRAINTAMKRGKANT